MSRCLLGTLVQRITRKYSMTFSRAFTCTNCLLASHYETLKVKPNATGKEIKEAYFQLSKENHPDLHPNDPNCHDRFIKLQDAYKVLSNPLTRQDYDRTLTGARRAKNPSGSYYSTAERPYSDPDFSRRDEWIRQQNARMREAKYANEFGERMDNPNASFNRYYSRPQNLSPEELRAYFRSRNMNKVTGFHFFVAIIFVFVMIMIIETYVFKMEQLDSYKKKMAHNSGLLVELNSPLYAREMREIENERLRRRMQVLQDADEDENDY